MKRIFDVILSLTGLIILAPVFCLIGIWIWTADGGPVLFEQTRVGFKGRDFTIFKFRTMTDVPNLADASFDVGSSHRVTTVGKVLRRTKLDELPQLWNVVRGDMSLVGPRPEVRQWVQAYPQEWEYIHTVRPGITDPASIIYRNEETILASANDPVACYREEVLPGKIEIYKDYVSRRSFWGDILIIVKTLGVVIAR